MKKIFYLFTLMIMFMALSGCGEKAEIAQNNVQMANPMQELTDEKEINELSYGLTLPGDAEQAKTYLINGKILERRFIIDGADYTMRVKKGDSFEDISGLYYAWNSQMDISFPTEESVHMVYSGDGEYIDVINWFDKELSVNYSVSLIADKPVNGLSDCIEQMIGNNVK